MLPEPRPFPREKEGKFSGARAEYSALVFEIGISTWVIFFFLVFAQLREVELLVFSNFRAEIRDEQSVRQKEWWRGSGYTFRFIDKYSDKLIDFIKSERSFKKFKLRDRFWFYDLLFIDVLYYKNHLGSILFENMFKKNKFKSIFRFLDNESSFIEELKIISSFPKWIFIKSFFKNLPKIISNYL